MSQPLEFENIGYAATVGMVYGRTSTDAVGFWGTVPVVRQVTASTSNVSTTTGISTSSASVAITTWGFATQVEMTNAITAVSTLQTALKSMGIVAGGVKASFTYSSRPFDVVDYGSPGGAQFGNKSTSLLSFYGATPVARITAVAADISTATTVSASTNGVATTTWGWTTSSEFAMYMTAISTMQLAAKQLGILA